MKYRFLPLSMVVIIALLLNCAGSRDSQIYPDSRSLSFMKYFQPPTEHPAAEAVSAKPEQLRTLKDYLTYAALNNPELKAAFERWKAALAQIPRAGSMPDPTFSYAYFIKEIETRVGPQKHKFSFQQRFPWFGKRELRRDVARESANIARIRCKRLKDRLFYQVQHAYYEYEYLLQAIRIFQENVQLISTLEKVVQTRYLAGKTPYAALLQIQVESDRLRDRLQSRQDQQRPLKTRLNVLLNRPYHADLPSPLKVIVDTLAFSEPQLYHLLQQNNSELNIQTALVARAAESLSLTKKDYYPDITVGVDYTLTDPAVMPDMADSGKDPLMAKASLQLPLWWNKYRAAIHQSQANYLAARHQKTHLENQLRDRLETVLFKVRDAKRKIHLYQTALVPHTRQALNVAQSAFESGKVDYLNLIDAQRTLLEFELLLERAQIDYLQELAELELLIGRPLSKK